MLNMFFKQVLKYHEVFNWHSTFTSPSRIFSLNRQVGMCAQANQHQHRHHTYILPMYLLKMQFPAIIYYNTTHTNHTHRQTTSQGRHVEFSLKPLVIQVCERMVLKILICIYSCLPKGLLPTYLLEAQSLLARLCMFFTSHNFRLSEVFHKLN